MPTSVSLFYFSVFFRCMINRIREVLSKTNSIHDNKSFIEKKKFSYTNI